LRGVYERIKNISKDLNIQNVLANDRRIDKQCRQQTGWKGGVQLQREGVIKLRIFFWSELTSYGKIWMQTL